MVQHRLPAQANDRNLEQRLRGTSDPIAGLWPSHQYNRCLRRICQIPKGIGTQQQITRNQRLGHQTVLRFAQLNRELNNFNQHGMINPDWIARRDAILSARSNDPPYAPSPEEVDVRSLWD